MVYGVHPLSSIHLLEDPGRIFCCFHPSIVGMIYGVNKIMASLGRRKKFYCSFCREGRQILRHTHELKDHPSTHMKHTDTLAPRPVWCCYVDEMLHVSRRCLRLQRCPNHPFISNHATMKEETSKFHTDHKKQITPFHEQKNNVKHPLRPSSNHGFT